MAHLTRSIVCGCRVDRRYVAQFVSQRQIRNAVERAADRTRRGPLTTGHRGCTRLRGVQEMADVDPESDFFAGAMPKEEIGALRFLKENPDCDGRDVVIAIFDTGVDPGTKGLQITTDGRPKIVDVVDCTGCGDVDTSEIVELDSSGCVKGVNGKLMAVHPDWKNPTGKWHVGIRPGYELFPSGLVRMMTAKRRKKFEESQREALTQAHKELAEFKAAHPKCTAEEDQKTKTELESRIQLLQTLMSNYKDPGPMIDCVVWHDGQHWRAALDTSDLYSAEEGKGKLADFTPLTNFAVEHGYGTISELDACNFVCNVYEDGNLLSIVIDGGMHGTHVAGIAAAYHPDRPEFNGIAPGARILACKIGDTRVGTMETGVALVRAAIAALQWKVDLVNVSYGECYAYPNSGRVLTVFNDLVHKHGIIVVTSAGNQGPALSTVGAPACCDGTLTIGAYVSPSMAAVAHSIREKLSEGRQYTFSSRGPIVNGALGVDLSAPGGAISDVPQWCGRSRMLANGTSMASPSSCGGIALLISGLKQAKGKITPSRLRRALINTAHLPTHTYYGAPPELTYGHGLLQVDEAWKYLCKSDEADAKDIRFAVAAARSDSPASRSIQAPPEIPDYNWTSGIYIREPEELCRVLRYVCSVVPVLPEDAGIVSDKLEVEMKLTLEATAEWVKCPDALLLPHRGRSFEVEVDGPRVPPEINYAEIQGYDLAARWRGPLFRLPITVLSQSRGDCDPFHTDLGEFEFEPGKEIRRFVVTPQGATWAEMTLRTGEFEGSRTYEVEARSVIPGLRTDDLCHSSILSLTSGQQRVIKLAVREGRMLEICVAQYWSSLGTSQLSVEIGFHGVQMYPGSNLVLDGAAGSLKLQVAAPLRREKIKPGFSLKTLCIPLRPTESSLVPLNTPRDTLPNARVIHKLNLTYKLKLQEGGKIKPCFPMFNRQVYDCEVEAQMVQIFDANKKLILVSDIYPEETSVKKGDYTLLAVLRHDNTEVLKKFEQMPLIVEKQLEKAISVPVYQSHIESAQGGKTFNTYELYEGQMMTLVVGPLTESLPKDCAPCRDSKTTKSETAGVLGMVVKGTVSMGFEAPVAGSFSYVTPPKKTSPEASSESPEELSIPAKLSNAARDAKIKILEGLVVGTPSALEEFDAVLVQLKLDYPGHLPLLTAALKKYDALDESLRPSKVDAILELCEEIISCIDKTELAIFLARKCPDESKEGKERKKEATEEKDALILALEKQLMTKLKLHPDDDGYEKVKPIFEELRKWTDPQETTLVVMHAKLEAAAKRYAEAIKLLDGFIASDKAPVAQNVYLLRAEYAEALGWSHWAQYMKKHIELDFPKKFATF